ncbi:molybdopterin molybdenumtransferase MoeA [cyanobiont of Ornithocercus magnificus]|nr:molybdopterin molybdenumtransferase MoeA [cyanobiont of Ornithocercus magnificus]
MTPISAETFGHKGLTLFEARRQLITALTRQQTSQATCQKTERVSLDQSLDRVTAEPVLAQGTVPGFRASIMDGYAVGQSNRPNPGAEWLLVGCAAPAASYAGRLDHGEAIRILTGAPLPDGAGWVLPQELVAVDEKRNTIQLMGNISTNSWIRPEDEECRCGDTLLPAGMRLSPADLGRAAAGGVHMIRVVCQPRIGMLISGDELVPVGVNRPYGGIWESNSTLLGNLLCRLGYNISHLRIVADQPNTLLHTLTELADSCDVVVSTGGVSVGDSDWIRPLMQELGSVEFWKLFLKPGRPFAFGWIGDRVPFFGLPGNPVAAVVTALQLLWPALQMLEGQAILEQLPRLQVQLADRLLRKPGRPELVRARLESADDGSLRARIEGSQSSSRIGSLQGADLLLEIPAESEFLETGTILWAQLLRRALF